MDKKIELKPNPRAAAEGREAFTLTELLATVAACGILLLLLVPAWADPRAGTKSFQCLNNMRQLAVAWTLYSSDNHDQLAFNMDSRNNPQSPVYLYNGDPAWVTGVIDWTSQSYNTNTIEIISDKYSLLGSYLGRSTSVFACPATATFLSPAQRAAGFPQRCRSVSMNAAVGGGPKYAVFDFGWNQSSWYVAKKSTDFHSPAPGNVWVFMDEHPDCIDDGLMYTANYPVSELIELPGCQHEGACGITFADSHVDMQQWTGPVVLAHRQVTFTTAQQIPCSITDPDMFYLAQHTPQN